LSAAPSRRKLEAVHSRSQLFALAVLVFTTPASFAQHASPLFRLDLSQRLKPLQEIQVTFLNDDLILLSTSRMQQIPVGNRAWMVKDAEQSAETMVVDIKQRKQVRTVTLGNRNAHFLWPTHNGNLIVRVGDELWLYNGALQKISDFRLSVDSTPVQIELSPDRRMLLAQSWLRQKTIEGGWTKRLVSDLLQTDTLSLLKLENVPIFPQLADSGFLEGDENGGGSIYFRPFSDSSRKLLIEGKESCPPRAQVVGVDRVLVARCTSTKGQVINLGGEPVHQTDDASWSFAQTSISGKVFVLGFQQYSRMHFLKDLNLIADLAGVDDPADVVVLKAYARDFEKHIFELRWKPTKSEPLYNSSKNFAVGLSPDGQMMAVVHGSALEVYQLPASH
jgi:hypothetical protein